jgi:4-hydroxybenzoate polyprenyltransferase
MPQSSYLWGIAIFSDLIAAYIALSLTLSPLNEYIAPQCTVFLYLYSVKSKKSFIFQHVSMLECWYVRMLTC